MNKFETGMIYNGFKLIQMEEVEDINSRCHVFEHEKTGAKLFYAQNNDENKVFFVAFKTPPSDNCGTAHIMEHSVLCGSEKYPAKDPFNTLVKGSLNTDVYKRQGVFFKPRKISSDPFKAVALFKHLGKIFLNGYVIKR